MSTYEDFMISMLTTIASTVTISGTFNSLFRVLFIFPSRYLYAIGLRLYLAFDEIYHRFTLHSQRALLNRCIKQRVYEIPG